MSLTAASVRAPARAWHGPLSLLGVVVGLLVEAVPLYLQQDSAYWLLALPAVVGLVLLAGGARLRQLGTGLLAAGLAYPIALVSFLIVALLG